MTGRERHLDQLAPAGSPAAAWLARLDLDRLPRHVAIIMDGNGRWAGQRSRPRVLGHRAGVESVRDIVEAGAQLGLELMTVYAFSTENWARPRHEVWTLMNLLRDFLRSDIDRLIRHGVRLRVLGRREPLDQSLLREIDRAVEATAGGERMTLNVALNYSGRCEIVDACRAIVADWAAGEPVEIDEETVGRYLYTSGQPDPDLLIRTSGESRISNFLLWQLAYTEIWWTPKLWPDFRREDLLEAIHEFQQRERRFGGVDATAAAEAVRAEAG
ncbi:MAG: isoprenyl transferase [Acidobacteriota bacterium]